MLNPTVADVRWGFLEQLEDIEKTFPLVAYLAPVYWVFVEVCLKRSLEAVLPYYELEMAFPSILNLEAVCS